MPKGNRKRKAAKNCFFTVGNKLSPQKYRDLGQNKRQNGSCALQDLQQPGSCTETKRVYNLRSRQQKIEEKDFTGNRIVNLPKLLEMFNTILREHSETMCQNPTLEFKDEIKYGLGTKIQLQCTNCAYKTTLFKLYEEMEKTKRASINTNLAVALLDSPMGISRAETFFSHLDLPFPAASHIQTLTNEVSAKIEKINCEDMAVKRDLVRQHNSLHDATDPYQIDISMDARYNRQRMKSSYKPGQSSSQAYAIATENHTDKNYIIGLAIENKLCLTGAVLKNKGLEVKCPGGHAGCTANLYYFEPHSERRMAFNIAQDLSLENFYVRTLTTDGDTKSYLGMQDFYDKLEKCWEVTRQADPNHLAACQERKMRSAAFSINMFPVKNKRDRQRAQSVLARDIKLRSSAIIKQMTVKGKGDVTRMIPNLPEIRSATVECYAGNCSNCPTQSLVCSGEGIGCWWYKSSVLGPAKITYLRMNDCDKVLMELILQMRLSESAIFSVSSGTSTQKCEAFNRAATATMSKSISYSRTFTGRLSAQILRSNNTVDLAIKKKLWKISGTALCIWANRRLQTIARRAENLKKYKKTGRYKNKRQAVRSRFEYEYQRMHENATVPTSDYIK